MLGTRPVRRTSALVVLGALLAAGAAGAPASRAGAADARPAATERDPGAGSAESARRAELRRLAAMVGPDFEALDELWAPDLRYGHSNGRVEDKAAFLARLRSGEIRYARFEPLELAATLVAPGVAVVRGRAAVRALSGGERVDVELGYLAVYAWRDGRWRMTDYQSAPRPAAASPPAAPRP